ncbi:hypothetical protein [Rhizobium sp. YS-1r]|uniref:Uncharacterized protein n=1 Tax=Neorhizobium phenanthreniclasticum TaxID=3157917 RepID=A0ABV0M7Q4_9HYPH|nr:hypothetical protein [Rhizobium sp. YS-1r]KGD96874.1 hypothetical protein JL39_15800 [Rhizobium sp. YS-1r]
MLFELIAAVVAGVALAGIAMGLRWISRGHLPKWIVPAAAGLGMLSYAVWSEYTWFSRVTNAMPPTIAVTWQHEDRSFWRPWSYYRPVIDRFSAVDTGSAKRHPEQPGQVMVDLVLAARWQQPARVTVVFDCNGKRQANLVDQDVTVAQDGAIIGAKWSDIPADDPTLAAACKQD